MNIIKLSAINSTNDYLKQLVVTRYVENFTVVTAQSQTDGKGQMGAKWNTEPGKNLTFSILIKDLLLKANDIFSLNVAVAVSIIQALEIYNLPNLTIKWPNDILAGNKKVGGILIENSFKPGGEIFSIVGVGLNINQKNFEELTRASSLTIVSGHEYDIEVIMLSVLEKLRHNVARLMHNDIPALWQIYHERLYKAGQPMPFECKGKKFMGIIKGVTQSGMLRVALEDDIVAEYAIKEVQLLY